MILDTLIYIRDLLQADADARYSVVVGAEDAFEKARLDGADEQRLEELRAAIRAARRAHECARRAQADFEIRSW